jgi:glycosyltransferase involved in cell wall biosynthesis
VEKHTREVGKALIKKGHSVTILTEKYDKVLKDTEVLDGIKVIRFGYPHAKLLGLLFIWWNIMVNIKLIKQADIVHIHDIFIWYLPFRFLYSNKRVVTTFHGWEGKWPIPVLNIFQKRIASALSHRTIAVGKFIEKYYGVKADKILYGGALTVRKKFKKVKNRVVFVGRLEEDTGVQLFLNDLDGFEYRDVLFIGDGELRYQCRKYGKVVGFTDPGIYFKSAEYVVPAGYLSYIEARSFGCKTITFANNPLKEDYWNEIKSVKKFPTWEEVSEEYLKLYRM